MQIKKIVLCALCAGWLFFPVTVNSGIFAYPDSKEILETEPVDLKGKLDPGPGIRSGGDVITAEVQDNVIMALFHKDVGNLLVTLTNGTGETVYEATVDTSVQQQAFIPLSGLPSGIYTITFSNNFGSMYGDFEI
ncbi:MAG: DUF3244 domain-containing protein [Proteiniphilum sp.]|jgi:hypothetical protein|uniref:DUF3244 domain-containing protein n=1 Tax=Proteiniphilum sp. TaxID=1926877 RepID=UPI002B20BCE6|nr:DUF3244 domain-containing protein [Proteiniphilum sp.]MEA5062107.1 DUF3244 domain-containing protein [Petrimonas sp.]MEA5128976.1 DUF3244 domain-containing protein [Proteiniphilum sp.]